MRKKQHSSDATEYLGKTKKANIVKYEITQFEFSYKDFPIPLSSSFYINNYAYMLVRRGKGLINISGYNYDFCKNSIVSLVPSHTAQFVNIDSQFEAIGLIITPEFYNKIPPIEKVFKYLNRNLKIFNHPVILLSNKDFHVLLNSLLEVHSKIKAVDHLMQQELIQNTFTKFLFEWINCIDSQTVPDSHNIRSSRSEQILNDFVILLREHFREEHLAIFYADKLHISPQYLTSIIKKLTGKTISQFIYDLLYSEASILLNQTNLSIQQIAEELHFSDASAFSKFFKRRSGLTPLKYRNK